MALKLLCLPLDDRPCSYDALVDLTRIGRVDFKLPPRDLIATHSPTRSFDKIFQWLDFQLGWNDAAVISLDMFLYGGLVPSRKAEISTEVAFERLEKLRELLQVHRDVRVYFSSVLLRLSVTVNAEQSENVWRDVFRYSVLNDTLYEADSKQSEIIELKERIPHNVLKEYLGVRERNAAVTRELLCFKERFSYLIYGQEDCAPHGLHRVEKEKLKAAISHLDLSERSRITVCTGADELTSMLCLRAFMDAKGCRPSSRPLCFVLPKPQLERVSNYEDTTVEENLKSHLELSPYFLSETEGRRLGVAMFSEKQSDIFFLDEKTEGTTQLGQAVSSLRKGDGFLDLTYANGAAPQFLKLLKETQLQNTLIAFSAWNTTGNRLGTLIAHLGFIDCAGAESDGEASLRYLYLHLLDDALYQSCVRAKLIQQCKALGENPWSLSSAAWKELSLRCDNHMQELAKEYRLDRFPFRSHLPWNRVFEVCIEWTP